MNHRIIKELVLGKEITLEIKQIGNDCNMVLYGGDVPHIGCTVLAVPLTRAKEEKKISCTSSVLNVTSHKDEEICRLLAEKMARKINAVVVCTGGVHFEDITMEQIEEVKQIILKIADEI
jgi:hypothetical protein